MLADDLVVRCWVDRCTNTFMLISERTIAGGDRLRLCDTHLVAQRNRMNAGLLTTIESLNEDYRKGEHNINWNGGVAYYPDHSLFKRMRKIVLEKSPFCACGRRAQVVHHKNHDRSDHSEVNLQALCCKCHSAHHKTTVRISKFRRILGASLQEVAKTHHVSLSTIKAWVETKNWRPNQPRPGRKKSAKEVDSTPIPMVVLD